MAYLVFDFHIHLSECDVEAIWHKDWIPAEVIVSLRRNNLAITSANEDLGLSVRSFTKCEDALCVCCLVFKAYQHFVETLSSNISQEIFDVGPG